MILCHSAKGGKMFGDQMTLNGYDILVLGIIFMALGIAINIGTREILKAIERTHDHLGADVQSIKDELGEVNARLEKYIYGD